MRIAIISDLHLGKKQYRTEENAFNRFEQIGYRAFKENIQIIKSEKPDLVINAGDTFDVANPQVYPILAYANGMEEIKDIPTMTILGNHDFSVNNRKTDCTAIELAIQKLNNQYVAYYDIKTVVIDNILFVMMPYRYDTVDNIKAYLQQCYDIAKNSDCEKKILVTHGVTDRYYRESYISDPISLSDNLVELFDLVIIGHIHTPYSYKQKKTLVLSPGGLIDYQAYEDHTGPIILDTDTMKFERKLVKTPHIIKKSCNDKNINSILSNVTEDIYHISFDGDTEKIDHDLFIKARQIAVNIVIEVVQKEEEISLSQTSLNLNLYEWVKTNYPDYHDKFITAKEGISSDKATY